MLSAAVSLTRRVLQLDRRAAERAQHDFGTVYLSLRERLRELHGDRLKDLRVLDFGCGYTYPFPILLRQDVREVVGLEVAPVFRDGLSSIARWTGGLRKPATTAEAWLSYAQAARYYRYLQQRAGLPVRHDQCRIVRYDGSRIPFHDGSFDVVISNAVLQELPGDLGWFAAEIARVLKPGGTLDLEWHNFYSWSGHYLGAGESRRHPWGHLRGGRAHPDLNRLTPDQVREAFSPWFTDLRLLRHDRDHRIAGRDPAFVPEAEEYLTTELERELAAYPREWLLTRGYILQGTSL